MNRIHISLLTSFLLISLTGCESNSTNSNQHTTNKLEACNQDWFEMLDRTIITDDGDGHGPDVGSGEWKSVITRKMGLENDPNLPNRDSKEWCDYIDYQLNT